MPAIHEALGSISRTNKDGIKARKIKTITQTWWPWQIFGSCEKKQSGDSGRENTISKTSIPVGWPRRGAHRELQRRKGKLKEETAGRKDGLRQPRTRNTKEKQERV